MLMMGMFSSKGESNNNIINSLKQKIFRTASAIIIFSGICPCKSRRAQGFTKYTTSLKPVSSKFI